MCTKGTRKPRNTFNQAEQGSDLRLRKVTGAALGESGRQGEGVVGAGRWGGGQSQDIQGTTSPQPVFPQPGCALDPLGEIKKKKINKSLSSTPVTPK